MNCLLMVNALPAHVLTVLHPFPFLQVLRWHRRFLQSHHNETQGISSLFFLYICIRSKVNASGPRHRRRKV